MLQFCIFVVLSVGYLLEGVSSQSATCSIVVNSNLSSSDQQSISGTVDFTTESGGVNVAISLTGFSTTDSDTSHGFHVHELGDLSNGCQSTGSHYNPTSDTHAGRLNSTRHVGDLGNIVEDSNGAITTSFVDSVIVLSGTNSIMSRAIVIHKSMDDLGASGSSSGAAGARLACCIITSPSCRAVVSLWLLLASLLFLKL